MLLLGVLASSFLLAAGSSSQAAYSYSTTLSITSVSPAGGTITNGATTATYALNGTTVTLSNVSAAGPFNGSLSPSIGSIQLASTFTGNPGQAFTLVYTDVLTITDSGAPGTPGTFTITGSMAFSGVTSSSATVTNVFSGSLLQSKTIGVTFTRSLSAAGLRTSSSARRQ
jgi:hypothetical protein